MNGFKTKIMFAALAVILLIGIVGIAMGVTDDDNTTDKQESVAVNTDKKPVVYSSTEELSAEITPVTPVVLDVSDVIGNADIDEDGFTYNPEEGAAVDGRVTVTAESVTIRDAAGINSTSLGIAYEGDAFVWIAEFSTEGWVSVDYNGTVAYVNADYVSVDGITDRSDEVFTAGVAGMTVPSGTGMEGELLITPLPTNTPTPTPSPTPTNTPTPTPSPTPTNTPVPEYVPSEPSGDGSDIVASVSDEVLLTCLIATESGYDYTEKLAVGSVVINRCNGRGQTMYEVITAPYQFSVYGSGILANAIENYLNGTRDYTDAHNAALEVLNGGPTVSYQGFRAYYSGIENDLPGGERIGATWFH